ncbi:MAG TPA: ComEA family DNA-binding protein [Pyrinomonadaceae bacterium]|jgi:competence protein ComEA
MNRRLPSHRNARERAALLCLALTLSPACAKLPRRASADATAPRLTQNATASPRLVNLNRATREELARLPGVGAGLAARIVEHRERHGAFRRAEHLLMVRGISERRYEQLRALVTVE